MNDSLLGEEQGADSLPEEETFTSADEALAETIVDTFREEDEEENTGGTLTSSLVHTITSRYEESSRHRDQDEQRWLQAYQNYRGLYAKNIKFTETEKSRVFVKVTKTKVLAAYGQLIDVLFGTEKFPISIRQTPVPEGAESIIHYKQGPAPDPENPVPTEVSAKSAPTPLSPYAHLDVGFAGDGKTIPPGATLEEVVNITQGMSIKIPEDKQAEFTVGGSTAGEPQFKPASDAALRMERLIHDQIEESDGARELRSALFESALLGTGIIKGPFTTEKTLHKWTYDPATKARTYKPEKVKTPTIEFCSVFDAFPDPAANTMQECEWFIQRHKLSKTQVRALKNRPFFNKERLSEVLDTTPNYVKEDYEIFLEAENNDVHTNADRWEVLEYWGIMDVSDLQDCGLCMDETILDEVQVNAWVCMGKLLRIVINPFTPKRIPYLAFDYEKNPYTFFGVGVAENMSDAQMIMNGHVRMAIDNLALAGNMVFDVDENAMAAGQNFEIYPGKVFKRQSGVPGQAVYGIKFPNTAPENMQMFDKFRQLADEATGIPSFAHGQTGITSTTRTASGMSMLMGAASLSVKTVVKNIDDFLLKPLGEAMFQWNMSFYEGDLDVIGDLEVSAGGAASLMKNEIRSQRLTAFGQLFANPAIAPFIKIPAYVKAFVESLDLDPTELINNEDEAKVYAAIMGAAGGIPQVPNPGAGGMQDGQGQVGGVPAPQMPGEQGFAANTGGMPPEAAGEMPQ